MHTQFCRLKEVISQISTGMYLNLRLGGCSSMKPSSLAELLVAPLLFWLEVMGVHLKSRRWEPLLPLTPPLAVGRLLLPELGGVPWIHFFFHLRTGPVNTVVVGAYLLDDRPSLAPTPSIYDGGPVLTPRLIILLRLLCLFFFKKFFFFHYPIKEFNSSVSESHLSSTMKI